MLAFVGANGAAANGAVQTTSFALPAGTEVGDLIVLAYASASRADPQMASGANVLTLLPGANPLQGIVLWVGPVVNPDGTIDYGDLPLTGAWSSGVAVYRGATFAINRMDEQGNGDAGLIAAITAPQTVSVVRWGDPAVPAPVAPLGYAADYDITGSNQRLAFAHYNGASPTPTDPWTFAAATPWDTSTFGLFAPARRRPAQRIYPREDGLRGGVPRVYPPPRTRQAGNRVTGYL